MQLDLTGGAVTVPEDGYIIRWRVKHGVVPAGLHVRLRVMRRTMAVICVVPPPSGTCPLSWYTGAGSTDPKPVSTAAGVDVYSARLPVQGGEQIALQDVNGGLVALYPTPFASFGFWPGAGPIDGGPGSPPTGPRLGEVMFSADVQSEADLAVTLWASPNPLRLPGLVSYTIRVTNMGPNPADAVRVSDPLPSGPWLVEQSQSQGFCVLGVPELICSLGRILPGSAATVTFAQPLSSEKPLTDTTRVTASSVDRNPANNSATVTSPVFDSFSGVIPVMDKVAVHIPRPLAPHSYRVIVPVKCTATKPDRCVGSLVLTSPRSTRSRALAIRYGAVALNLTAGPRTLTVPLNLTARRKLAKNRTLAVNIKIITHDRYGTIRTTGGHLTLKRPGR